MIARNFAILIPVLTVLTATPPTARANSDEISAMREQLTVLSQRLDSLEEANNALREENEQLRAAGEKTAAEVEAVSAKVAKQESASSSASWAEKIKLKGDFRFRYENIDLQGKAERKRERVRARAAIVASVNKDLEVGLGMASGGDDPVSTNQTLGDGGSTKDLNLDLAYFSWSGPENTRITGGKFKNFMYKPGKSQLQWDGDWNPEGVGIAWGNGDYFFNWMGSWIEGDSNKESETSYVVQAGFNKNLSDNVSLTAGISYADYGTAGKGTFYGDDDEFFGNSFDPVTNTYLYNYEVVGLFASLGFELAGKPASFWVDLVRNQDAPTDDAGFAAGFSLKSGKGSFGYSYVDQEKDSTLGLLVDSDFGGGGTDNRGHVLSYSHTIQKNWTAGIAYFSNETDVSSGAKLDYDRLQADLVFKY